MAFVIGDKVHVHAVLNGGETVMSFDGEVVRLGAKYVWVTDGKHAPECYKPSEVTRMEPEYTQMPLPMAA
jgi:hypothetical protein